MAKYVKTDYVPEGVNYITKGKEYILYDSSDTCGWAIADSGKDLFVFFESSSHLEGRPWTVINH